MYIKRMLEEGIINAGKGFPVVLLTGPRQVGKTTLFEHLSKNKRQYVSLDNLTIRSLAQNDPELFLQKYTPPLIIDEIQYAPQLLPYIKEYVDKNRINGGFWITGSQQFHLMRNVTESLAGRVAIIKILGFSYHEKKNKGQKQTPFIPEKKYLGKHKTVKKTGIIDIYKEIWKGSMPSINVNSRINHDLFFDSYLQTYIQRDVRDLMQIGNIEDFTKFVKACAARTGQLLNIADIAKDVDISVNTAKSWLSILIASFQVYLLSPYHNNITKRLVKTPKLYFLDTGLCSYLTGWASPETLESGAMAGAIFETYVLGEILKSWWYKTKTPQLYYYRDKDSREIDLIIKKDNTLYPIEIKKSANPGKDWIANFSCLNKFPEKTGPGACVCMVKEVMPIDKNNFAVPVWNI